jgi:hypothetical protein
MHGFSIRFLLRKNRGVWLELLGASIPGYVVKDSGRAAECLLRREQLIRLTPFVADKINCNVLARHRASIYETSVFLWVVLYAFLQVRG